MPPTAWPPWAVMWTLAAAVFAGCKWLTWRRTPAPAAPAWRHAAYLLAWPGLDAKAFLDPRPLPPRPPPDSGRVGVRRRQARPRGRPHLGRRSALVPADLPLLRGWVGMAGLVFLLHFGVVPPAELRVAGRRGGREAADELAGARRRAWASSGGGGGTPRSAT